jgi:hypothetical protein
MKHYRYLALATMLLSVPNLQAEFLQIDLSIFGMD